MKVWTDKSHYDFKSSTAFKKKLFLEKIFSFIYKVQHKWLCSFWQEMF